YTLNTDATGAYTSNAVIAGTYEYTVTAAGYVEQTKADVVVAFGTTATEDFYMIETAYPVGNVHATEIDDNTVKVTWGEVPAEGWLARDDGNMVFGGIGGPPGEPMTFQTAVKFTPDMLEDYLNSGFITSISLAQIANIPTVSELRIYQGAGMDDLIYTQDILADFAYDNSTEVVTLDDAVAFDATQNLWISIYSEQPADGFNAPLSFATDFVSGTSDIYAMNGVWTSVEESFGLGGYAFMLRAYATTDAGSKSVALGTVEIPEGKYKDYSAFGSTSTGLKGKVESDKVYTVATMNSKSLLGFNIYRLPCTVDAVASEYFIGYTLDAAQFTDNSWGTVDWGMYKWAVEAVYTNDNLAPAAFSVECLDKEMETLVNMTVTTNSGDSPGGTSVTFKNTIETGLDDITTTIPGSGMKTIDP
ncbi:MAG: carboxypeptidase regulatory-like domain-containing protein, partial [Chlamydiia bacterium]|nr:carboxypeptidase regulatory-like domain-containing protein [Chlamydiia bacterium]